MTEFGRSLLVKAGSTLSKVQIVKQWIAENIPIVLAHVGANQFYTEVYWPDKRRHRFDLADENGQEKSKKNCRIFDIAGPLCFQGDYLAKKVELPDSTTAGDILIMHETGANGNFNMLSNALLLLWSKFQANILKSHDFENDFERILEIL